jgi:hypothetical protein
MSAEYDGKGCPVMVWDGPYKHRCGLGARVGECAYHGRYAPTPLRPGNSERDNTITTMPWPATCDHKRATCEEVGCPNAEPRTRPGSGGPS